MRRSLLALLLAGCGAASSSAPHSDPTHGSTNTSASSDPTSADPEGPNGPTAASNVPVASIPTPPDVAGPPPGTPTTPSGLASRVLRPGSGTVHPGPTSRVRVHYSGWTTDGQLFDSSRTRGEVAEFPLSAVIVGWTEGVQLMVVGEERRFWIPGSLAYGDTPHAGRPYGMLVFDVELLAIDP